MAQAHVICLTTCIQSCAPSLHAQLEARHPCSKLSFFLSSTSCTPFSVCFLLKPISSRRRSSATSFVLPSPPVTSLHGEPTPSCPASTCKGSHHAPSPSLPAPLPYRLFLLPPDFLRAALPVLPPVALPSPVSGLHSEQNQEPFGGSASPTQARWNHSIAQSSFWY